MVVAALSMLSIAERAPVNVVCVKSITSTRRDEKIMPRLVEVCAIVIQHHLKSRESYAGMIAHCSMLTRASKETRYVIYVKHNHIGNVSKR